MFGCFPLITLWDRVSSTVEAGLEHLEEGRVRNVLHYELLE